MTTTQPLLFIKDAAAAKAGAYSNGAVLYRLLTDSERSDVYFSITGNQGGSGYFSREAVPFGKVRHCVADVPSGTPLPSKAFRAAFVGRSTNNPGFLAAILRAEGLLSPAPDNAHQHLISGDWDAWHGEQLALPATPLAEPAAEPPQDDAPQPAAEAVTDTDAMSPMERLKARKSRKGQPAKGQHPDTAGEGGDAGAE